MSATSVSSGLTSKLRSVQTKPIRIGTRGSNLALAQAHEVRRRLQDAHGIEESDVEIVVIKTSGDRIQDRPLAEVGGKGLFTKEIEQALLERSIDLAVHSMKDMPTVLPEGLVIPCLLPREDPRDAFISPKCGTLLDLPRNAVVGSSSLRRQAQIRKLRPDIDVVMYRGNVETRLRKLREGEVDATLLACAGLKRLGLAHEITEPVDTNVMLPAVAQGAIGIEVREGDSEILDLIEPLGDRDTFVRLTAERAFLAVLDGSCRTPIAGLAEHDGAGGLVLRAMILKPDGSVCHETSREGSAGDAEAMGVDAGAELKAQGGPDFFG